MMKELKQERVDTVDTDDYDHNDYNYNTESTSLAANNDASTHPPNDNDNDDALTPNDSDIHTDIIETTSSTLPPGWREVTDPVTGNSYFYHEGLGITQWDLPDEPTIVATDAPEEVTILQQVSQLRIPVWNVSCAAG